MTVTTTRQTDKLRYIYLGQTLSDRYIYLESDLTPDQIISRTQQKILTTESFTPAPTDWGGCDDLEHIYKIKAITPRDHLPLIENLVFYGTDYDCGHEYSWFVEVNTIITVQ